MAAAPSGSSPAPPPPPAPAALLGSLADDPLSPDARAALDAHIHQRTRYRLRRKHYEQKFEIVGGVPGTSSLVGGSGRAQREKAEGEEVGDDWFGVKEELSHRTRVRLKLSRGRERVMGTEVSDPTWTYREDRI